MQLGLLDITYKFKILELTFNMDSTQASTAHLFKDDNQRERERERERVKTQNFEERWESYFKNF